MPSGFDRPRGALAAAALWALLASVLCGLLAAPTAATAAPALHVIPFPDTPDASPLSHVIFSSLQRSQIRSVTVTGSRSGVHTGRLMSLPDHAGTEYLPDQAFAAGEQVNVSAALSSPAAGTASGDPGATVLRFSFAIASPAGSGGAERVTPAGAAPTGRAQTSQSEGINQTFHSAPGLHPPTVAMTRDLDTSSGDLFLAPMLAPQNGPMILDSRGRLVWFRPTRDHVANLQVQQYQGHPVLTWWQGPSLGNGELVIMNRSYRTVRVLHPGEGYAADVHEFALTPQGTAFIDVSVPVKADLTSIGGGAQGNLWDYEIQELDVRTGQLLWEWHALGHVPVGASYAGQPKGWPPYDYFHLNSIQQLPNGDLLVSARNTWGVYEIDKQTGRVIWTLGGRYSNFKMAPGSNFEWQHDPRLVGSTLSVFDDAAGPQEEHQSSAKVLRLDTTTMTASLVRRYTHSPPLLAAAAGSTQILDNRRVLVGWGNQPDFSEYNAAGKQLFTASLPAGEYSYRVYRFPWTAQPLSKPVLAASRRSNGTTRVWASWNGATQVASWRVLGGPRPGALRTLASARRSGFETMIVLAGQPRYVSVQALDARGRILRTSGPQATS